MHPSSQVIQMYRRITTFLSLAALCLLTSCTALQPSSRNADRSELSFGVIADVQYCDCEASGSRYYRASPGKLQAAIDTFNTKELDFVIHLGDLIDRRYESFGRVLPIYRQLKAPSYHVLGNHDFSVADEQKPAVPELLGMEQRYYDFSHGSWRFIVLDGNDLSLYARTAGTPRHRRADSLYQQLDRAGRPNAQTWNGGLGREQLRWLKDVLEGAHAADEKVIVFAHFPAHPPGAHNLWNDGEVVDLLANYDNVVAFMNGHNHRGDYSVKDGIHFLTLPGMVETPTENAFAVVDVLGSRLQIDGWGRVEDRVLIFD